MITDPQVIKFVNESIRPMAEKLRALKVEIDSAAVTYAGVVGLIPNSAAELLADGRENEGVSRLTGEDITSLIVEIGKIKAQLEVAGVSAIIAKPCVRALRAE